MQHGNYLCLNSNTPTPNYTVNQKNASEKVCVLGLGYIGLPTAAILASHGHQVHGVEINPGARDIINEGKAHIIEPDLDMLVSAAVTSKKLRAYAAPAEADVFILCVPTPVGEESGADLSYVRAAAESIIPVVRKGNLVILESTSPPGTTELIASIINQKGGFQPGEVRYAHAPERVLPGRILKEVVENDRIIGGLDSKSTEAAAAFYRTFVTGQLLLCSARMAELAKLTENASRDVQIAFANELSMICHDLDLDVRELISLANRHPRVKILQPGCGVGGHCIAVDPWFIVHMAKGKARLMKTAREVNNAKPHWVVERVEEAAEALGGDPVIACMGAAYKPDIDDMRESPALEIIHSLQRRRPGKVIVVEPNLDELPGCELVPLDEAVARAGIVLFLVAHAPFKAMAGERLKDRVVLDYCGARPTGRRIDG